MTYYINTQPLNLKVFSTNASIVSVGNSYQDLEGSEVSYVPHPLAKKVIYEYNFHYSWAPDASTLGQVIIQKTLNGTYQDLSNDYRKIPFNNDNGYSSSNGSLFYILDSWQGVEKVKLRIRSLSADYEFRIHTVRTFEQSVQETKVFPTLKIYSI